MQNQTPQDISSGEAPPPGRRGGDILGLKGGPKGSMQNQAPRIWAQESSPLERRGGADLAQWGSYEKGSRKAKLSS